MPTLLNPTCWLAGESQLSWLELDISDSDVPPEVDKIAVWLESTGGIYPDYCSASVGRYGYFGVRHPVPENI